MSVEARTLQNWCHVNEYDTESLHYDVYEYMYEGLPSEHGTSNVAETFNENQMFKALMHFVDIGYFNDLSIIEKCEWKKKYNTLSKRIENYSTQELINLMNSNIFNAINDVILNKNKQHIFDCFRRYKIDGRKLKSIEAKEFCEMIMEDFTNEAKVMKLYKRFEDILNTEKSEKEIMMHDLKTCSIIGRILFITFNCKQMGNQKDSIEQLVDIFNRSNYQIKDLMNDIYHLFHHHQFIKNNTLYKLIKDYLINAKHIGKCINDDCISMQRHCRKYRFEDRKENEENTIDDVEIETWITLLDQIHCPLFHDKSTDFRNRYKQQMCENTVETDIGVNINFPYLQFGVNVDEWLPFGTKPKFENMEQEVRMNEYIKISKNRLNKMKCEMKHRCLSASNDQHLNITELL
eukprot:91622_1